MNQIDLHAALSSLGIPVAYSHFLSTEERPAPNPPFITYLFVDEDDLIADNQNYLEVGNFQIELYTDKKDLVRERQVRDLLRSLDLAYSKTETWLETERMYQIVYQIQLIGE